MVNKNNCRQNSEAKDPKSIYIVCEGKNTERFYICRYINFLIKKINQKNINNFSIRDPYGNDIGKSIFSIICEDNDGQVLDSIQIQINHIGKTDPVSIVEDGNKKSSKYDYIYCVFDKDAHVDGRKKNYIDAMKKELENNVKRINSIPYFEYFIRLHFEYSTSDDYCNSSSDEFIKNILNGKLKLDYSKEQSSFLDFFDTKLKDKLIVGIKNAKKLGVEQDIEIKTEFYTLLIELFKIFTEKIEDINYLTKNKGDRDVIKIMEKMFE